MVSDSVQRTVYEILTSEDDGRVCKDIPDTACHEQPQNFLKHVISLAATKTGDGLVDPKLVLSWLMTALGAPAYLLGLLVPLREAGALLPQLLVSGGIRSFPQRKWVWAAGSLVQGVAVVGMGLSALALEGAAAGWAIVALLALFAVARSACSVSYKDVLGKTVSKSTRGTATGTASSLAAGLVLLFGVLLSSGILEVSIPTIAGFLFFGGGLWLLATISFVTLAEEPGATDGGGNPLTVALEQIAMLKNDAQLVRYIVVRSLLISTALAPPYLVVLAGKENDNQLGQLGPFVIASALAAVGSSYVWGRLSDSSSRKVLVFSAIIAFLVLAAASGFAIHDPSIFAGVFAAPATLFVLMIAYQGVRLGRATHIVDMTDEDTRAAYTALSNTIIGIFLIAGGLFGFIAQIAGEAVVLAIFAGMSLVAIIPALQLHEVQRETVK